jgi:hypothetical protein
VNFVDLWVVRPRTAANGKESIPVRVESGDSAGKAPCGLIVLHDGELHIELLGVGQSARRGKQEREKYVLHRDT